jgi:2-polyprenyl-3-methyl-5-hydroxy-6-metoxy-1,4-benzoquinol methylase
MIYCFDIDGTLCTNTEGDYERAEPDHSNIDRVNSLYQAGDRILLYTARGATTGIDWRSLTEKQLNQWGVKYHALYMGKPTADVYVDDKAINMRDWFRERRSPDVEMNQSATPDYLELTYSEQRLPPSDYPTLLTSWLATNVFSQPGKLLDVGCGRGEYLKTFARLGFEVSGVDSAPSARDMAPGVRVDIVNIEAERLPFPDASFDYIYSKSIIEHLQQPSRMLHECFRVLRPGGVAAIMTPSWRHQWRVFYEDYTHVSPFTVNGLTDALTLAGFSDVYVRLFWQLPFLWRRPWLFPLTKVVGLLPLRYRPWDRAPWPESVNKLIRFSKEAMLMGIAKKNHPEK